MCLNNLIKIFFILTFIILFSSCSNRYAKSIEAHRKELSTEFVTETEGPLSSEDLKFLDYFEANEIFLVNANVVLLSKDDVIMKSVSGQEKIYIPYAFCDFEIDDQPYKLTLFQSRRLLTNPIYKDYLFLPFYDNSNGEETYGGGRYLDFKLSEIKDGKLIIDFNKSYNPWCAYSSGYNCTIPPIQNSLDINIMAGEKMYLGKHKHRNTSK